MVALKAHLTMASPCQANQVMYNHFHQNGSSLLPGQDSRLASGSMEVDTESNNPIMNNFEEVIGKVDSSCSGKLSAEAEAKCYQVHYANVNTLAHKSDSIINTFGYGSRSKQYACHLSSSSIGSTICNSDTVQTIEVTSPAPSNHSLTSRTNSLRSSTLPYGKCLSVRHGYLHNRHYQVMEDLPVDPNRNSMHFVSSNINDSLRSGVAVSRGCTWDVSSSDCMMPQNKHGRYDNYNLLHNDGFKEWSTMSSEPSFSEIAVAVAHDGALFAKNNLYDCTSYTAPEPCTSYQSNENLHLRPNDFAPGGSPATSSSTRNDYGNMNISSIRSTYGNIFALHNRSINAPQEPQKLHHLLPKDGYLHALLEEKYRRHQQLDKDIVQFLGTQQYQESSMTDHCPQQHTDLAAFSNLGVSQPETMKIYGAKEQMRPERSTTRNVSGQPPPSIEKSISSQLSNSSYSAVTMESGTSEKQERLTTGQEFLLAYYHGITCSESEKCGSSCLKFKSVLHHMADCNDVKCKCFPCRRLLDHHKDCYSSACGTCSRVRAILSVSQKQSAVAVELDTATSFDRLEHDQPPRKCLKTIKHSDISYSCYREESQMSVAVTGHPNLPLQVHHVVNEGGSSRNSIVENVKHEAKPSPSSQGSCVKSCETKSEEPEVAIEVHPSTVAVIKDETIAVDDRSSKLLKGVNKTSNVKCEKNASSCTAHVAGKNLVKPKSRGVSLVDYFTPEQMKGHIRSLAQSSNRYKSKAQNLEVEQAVDEYSCSLCKKENLLFEPLPRYCASCCKLISPKGMYFSEVGNTSNGNDSQRFLCNKCFNIPGESVKIIGGEILKAHLIRRWNYAETDSETESWVQCDKCESWQHQICALFNCKRNDVEQDEYTCANCLLKEMESGEKRSLPLHKLLGAQDVPTCVLSDHIEQWLFRRLKEERQERANLNKKTLDEVPTAEGLVIRVVSSVNKKVEVREAFREVFQNYPSEFPYVSKAVLLFQKIDGADVCLFGMYVQEFGSECALPNQRHVCISYIDSVKYFRPEVKAVTGEALRTFVYHEILIGYLDYCKKRGYVSCYIWACPPLKQDDYILYCHPEQQKLPKSDKLREWYQAMIKKASKEKVVVESTNLYDQFFLQTNERKAKITASRLPYFDSDYWPGEAENLLRNDGSVPRKKTKKNVAERVLRAARREASDGNPKDILLMHELGEFIRPMKEVFIMIHLWHACKHCSQPIVTGKLWVCNVCKNFHLCEQCYNIEKNLDKERHPIHVKEKHDFCMISVEEISQDTSDQDEDFTSELFDTRIGFLTFCQLNKYQFDTLRRAKYSTMMILYHLHNPTTPAFMSSCSFCHNDIETAQWWHCLTCSGYDMCDSCYQRHGGRHHHKLVRKFEKADCEVSQQKANCQRRTLQIVLNTLTHACNCSSRQCSEPFCRRVKLLFFHGAKCQVRVGGGCIICKRMWQIVQCHARVCRDPECRAPRCRDMKAHMRNIQLQADSRRRAAMTESIRH